MRYEYFAPRLQCFGPSLRAATRDAVGRPRPGALTETDREVRHEVVREPHATAMERRYEDPDDFHRSRERDDMFGAEPVPRDDDELDAGDDVLDVSDDVLDVTNDSLTVT